MSLKRILCLKNRLKVLEACHAIFEYPLICSCNQFTKPIQALFKIIRSQYVPLIVSVSLNCSESYKALSILQGQFPLLEKPHNSIKRLILNIGFFADEILLISITHIVQTFDTRSRFVFFQTSRWDRLRRVRSCLSTLGIWRIEISLSRWTKRLKMCLEHVCCLKTVAIMFICIRSCQITIIHDTANNMQYFLYIMTNFKKDVNPFDSITTPTRLECDLSKHPSSRMYRINLCRAFTTHFPRWSCQFRCCPFL